MPWAQFMCLNLMKLHSEENSPNMAKKPHGLLEGQVRVNYRNRQKNIYWDQN